MNCALLATPSLSTYIVVLLGCAYKLIGCVAVSTESRRAERPKNVRCLLTAVADHLDSHVSVSICFASFSFVGHDAFEPMGRQLLYIYHWHISPVTFLRIIITTIRKSISFCRPLGRANIWPPPGSRLQRAHTPRACGCGASDRHAGGRAGRHGRLGQCCALPYGVYLLQILVKPILTNLAVWAATIMSKN